jgi:hypothetical protein
MSVQDGPDISARAAWQSRMTSRSAQLDGMDPSGVRRVFHENHPPGVHEIDYTRWSLALVAGWLSSARLSARTRAVLGEYHRELRLDADLFAQRLQRDLHLAAQKLDQMKRDAAQRLQQAREAEQRAASAREWTDRLLNELSPLAQQAARELRAAPNGAPVLLGYGNNAPVATTEQTMVVDMELDQDDEANQQPPPSPAQPVTQALLHIGWLHDTNPPRPADGDGVYLTFAATGWEGIRVTASNGRYEYFDAQHSIWYPTNAFFLWCNLFTRQPAGASPSFTCNGGPITVDWGHVTQHTFRYMTEFHVKEVHTLWPPEMDEITLAGHLQTALDHWATASQTTYNVPGFGNARLAWVPGEIGTHLRTFFPLEPHYQYTVQQMSDLADLVAGWN